ncbi:hypothetical protein L1049_000477 [Liquidambar formosana]|uniref:Uncharacterized protein n=1 Tax=Liquidambar formosana TaxID=63359 RepID=A0AAP0NB31_LIQFO
MREFKMILWEGSCVGKKDHQLGRSKWNGNIGNSGIVVRVESPISSFARPSFSIQLNSGVEF